ncbi:hypothetical protein P3S68_022536 [Capsicum galapagoense]
MEDGNPVFIFDRSGPFYFLSGNKYNHDKGQKLQIIVISVRKHPSTNLSEPQTLAPMVAPPSNGSSSSTIPSPSGGSTTPPSKSSGPFAFSLGLLHLLDHPHRVHHHPTGHQYLLLVQAHIG